MSADLEIGELTARNIPFVKWGGLKFLEAAHVKDVLAFLRVLENPRDEVSWYRILMLLPGIGDVTARAMMDTMADFPLPSGSRTPSLALRAAARARAMLHRQGSPALHCAGSAACRLEDREGGVGEDIDEIRALYDGVLSERLRPVRAAPRRSRPAARDRRRLSDARAGFLAALALEAAVEARTGPPPADRQRDTKNDALVISTVHSAKGKEWDAVFVIWAVDGWFPIIALAE